ncbi:MAG: SH3 domain-containing protein [Sulfurimicrobium sp.]|nr:SH3 domain-containing protein [Sulfurimicrobium sp.]
MMLTNTKRGFRMWLIALAALFFSGAASAGMQLDIEKELQLLRDGKAQQHIGKARYRFAVFTFDDPDGTGLGNAVASILSHDLLMNSKVSSVGVLRYVGNLGKASEERKLRYFDKVEPLIESQGVQVAIWGTIRRSGERVRIDSFMQLSPSVMRSAFSFSFNMPPEIGRGRLVHRIGPDRMLTQRLELPSEQALSLVSIAADLDRLRATPNDNAPFAGQLPLGSIYYLQRRQGAWVQVGMQSGQSGWLRSTGFCTGTCAPLLSVSRFASELMAYDDRASIPARSEGLAADAKAFIDQLLAVEVLNGAPARYAEQEALYRLKPWCPDKDEATGKEHAPSPGGAAICNLRAITRLVSLSRNIARQPQDGQLTGNEVRSVADELATVSMSDPRHVPTLKNLAILFGILGDAERAQLANRLAEEAGSASLVSAHDAAPLSGQTQSPEP